MDSPKFDRGGLTYPLIGEQVEADSKGEGNPRWLRGQRKKKIYIGLFWRYTCVCCLDFTPHAACIVLMVSQSMYRKRHNLSSR